MRRTFLNGNEEFLKVAIEARDREIETWSFYEIFNHCEDDDDFWEALKDNADNIDEAERYIQLWKNLSLFHEYGLSFDFVDVHSFEDMDEGYYRYQLSWGGPGDEIRFYESGLIEYVYLDWGKGAGFDVTEELQWLEDYFEEAMVIDWDSIPYEDKFK